MKKIIVLAASALLSYAAISRDAMYTWYEGLSPKNVLYAVNCGSEDSVVDVNGIEYKADRGYSDGQSSLDGYQQKKWIVPNTEVYYSERWSDSNFNYKIPLNTKEDATVTLILKFSEVYFKQPGEKQFDVIIGDTYVAKDLDPLKLSFGKYSPYDLFVEISIRSGKILIDGKEVKNAVKGSDLVVDFLKGKADNPKINAILLVKGGVKNTHQASFQKLQQLLQQLTEEKARIK